MTVQSKANKRLLVVSSFCDRPERETFCRMASEISVSMICDPENPGIDQLRASGVNVVPHDLAAKAHAEQAKILVKVVQDERTDVVYAPRTETLSLAVKALKTMNTRIVGYRGTTGHLSIVDIGPRLTYKSSRVDMIVCVSEAVRLYLLSKGISQDKLITIPKGHDVKWYEPAKREALTQLGIPEDAFAIGFAGRVRRIKGAAYLITALSGISPEINAHLLLAGDVDDLLVKAMLRSKLISKRVHAIGFTPDAPALMGACDAFVMPSLKREGLPRALVEAMAQRVPPVATNVGGIPELIEDGVSGILVPPRNPVELASALSLLATDREKARLIAGKARERIASHFNITDTAKRMLEIFCK